MLPENWLKNWGGARTIDVQISAIRRATFIFGFDWPGPEVIKLFMLNSADHEIYHAHKY